MKAIIAAALTVGTLLTAISTSALADQYVRGYTRSDGTYVQPHHRSNPDGNPYNNYNTQGNTNPYTGERGYEQPKQSTPGFSSPYQEGTYNQRGF